MPTTRRQFLKTSAAASAAWSLSAASYARVAGANDRISIGIIGCGSRGFGAHMPGVQRFAEQENVEITAVADPWSVRRERASAQVEKWFGRPARMAGSYRQILDLADVDAVMIASCDHQHTTHLRDAAGAGKDVYCEKPLGMDFDRVKESVDAVKRAGVVCQIGTQIRSLPTSTGCRELVRSGALGRITRIEQCRNGGRPYWYSYLAEADAADVDWQEFLMDRSPRPFRADWFTGWYGYRDFSDGPVPGLASHFIDLLNYITGSTLPESCTCQGGTFLWKDEHAFTCPDQVEATWVYPEGFLVNYTTNFGNGEGSRIQFYGEHGTLNLTPWTQPTVSSAGAVKPGELGESKPVEPVETPDHFLNWLQCMRTRQACNASIDAGYQHAVAVLMAVRAMDSGQRQVYDPALREIRAG